MDELDINSMTKEEIIAEIAKLEKEKEHLEDLSIFWDNKQNAIKSMLNTTYGALGSSFYSCFDIDNAEAVTKSGQIATKGMLDYINNELDAYTHFEHTYTTKETHKGVTGKSIKTITKTKNLAHVIAGDTDSLYIRMDAILIKLFGTVDIDWFDEETFLKIKDYVDNTLQIEINQHCADMLCEKLYTTERRIEFKREKISCQGEYFAKKRYICHVLDDEGIRCDKFKYVGVDIKKNELPNELKELLSDIVQNIIKDDWTNEMFQKEIRNLHDKYCALDINGISYIKNYSTTKECNDYAIQKGGGAHAKAAEYYNTTIEKLGLTKKYDKIKQDDRFHYFYCRTENPWHISVIGYKDKWPKEFNKYFIPDKEKMFEKTVIKPIETILTNHNFNLMNVNVQTLCDIMSL